MLSVEAPIETERLVLRRFRRGDLDALHEQQSRADVARYLPRGVRSRAEVEQVLARRIACGSLARDDDALSLAVERRDGRMIGDLTIWLRSAASRQVEIGYVFHPDSHGRGFATEAVRRLVALAFEGADAHRVYARAHPENAASTRLMTRLGMRLEAHFRENELFEGEWGDEVVYAILESEWRGRET